MPYLVLATAFDGTLAQDSRVGERALNAFERLRASGRRLDELLAEPLADVFLDTLREFGVTEIAVGEVIVATWVPHESGVPKAIRETGLELLIVFNKDAVMVLSFHETVGIGDAENDHAFLQRCKCTVAVSNAVPSIKQLAARVTQSAAGEGVAELIDELIGDDLVGLEGKFPQHLVTVGAYLDGRPIFFRDPEKRYNLKAHDLNIFAQLAEGIDDETWLFHLRRGDYSRWFRGAVKAPYLADQAQRIEQRANLQPEETRNLVRRLIETRYTLAE